MRRESAGGGVHAIIALCCSWDRPKLPSPHNCSLTSQREPDTLSAGDLHGSLNSLLYSFASSVDVDINAAASFLVARLRSLSAPPIHLPPTS